MASDYERLLFGELRNARDTGDYERVAHVFMVGIHLCPLEQMWDYTKTLTDMDRTKLITPMRTGDTRLYLATVLPPDLFEHVPIPTWQPSDPYRQRVYALVKTPPYVWQHIKHQIPSREGATFLSARYGQDALTDTVLLCFWYHMGWNQYRNPSPADFEVLMEHAIPATGYGNRHPIRTKQTQLYWKQYAERSKFRADHPLIMQEIAYLEDVLGFHEESR